MDIITSDSVHATKMAATQKHYKTRLNHLQNMVLSIWDLGLTEFVQISADPRLTLTYFMPGQTLFPIAFP